MTGVFRFVGRTPVSLAAIARDERRERRHLKHEPGGHPQPRAPAERRHDPDQLSGAVDL